MLSLRAFSAVWAVVCFLVGVGFSIFNVVVCFRMGLTSKEFEHVDNNRIFGEYCFCILLLFLVVCNYLG